MTDQLGLRAAVSMALGGMIGGGIYAVLGVVASITGTATWLAFALAGVVAMGAGYSYSVLNAIDAEHEGGSVAFVKRFTGNATAAGMVGWTLLVGYVGSMAMYAFAFAEFTVAFGVVPAEIGGIPLRPVVSVLAVAGFVGLNLLGAETTGTAEVVLVALKVAILVAFGLLGLVYAWTVPTAPALAFGTSRLPSFGPIMAAAVSFVAFQGWQLLFYDQESIADPVPTIRRAVYVSIPVAVGIYLLVGVVTVNLVPEAIAHHPHVALKDAARLFAAPYGLAAVGGVVIALSALFSTGSAINATLFSTAHFAKGMLGNDLLPDVIGSADVDGVPPRTVVVLGAITAALAVLGSLAAITAFASLAFIVVFGVVCALALRERRRERVDPVAPAVGLLGSAAFLPLMGWHLYRSEPATFLSVLAIAAAVLAVELLYFERELIERELEAIEERSPADATDLRPEVE